MINIAQLGMITGNLLPHPAYDAVLTRWKTLGYQLPSNSQQILHNGLMSALVNSGELNKLDLFHLFAIDGDSNCATINWVNPNLYQATKSLSPIHNINQGFQSNGTSSFILSSWVPSVNAVRFKLTDASIGAFMHTGGDAGATGKTVIGSLSATNHNILLSDTGNGNVSSRLNQDSTVVHAFTGIPSFQSGKSYAVDRTVTGGNHYVDGVVVSTWTRAASGLSNIPLGFLARRSNTGSQLFADPAWKLAAVWIGSGAVNQTMMHSIIKTYMLQIA